MTLEDEILEDFKKKVCDKITLKEKGKNRFMVVTPFKFEDGDTFKILLKKEDDNWYLTDEGHTLMHISYEGFEIDTDKRKELFSQAINRNFLEEDEGEIKSLIENKNFGNALYSFVQGLMKIIDLEYLSQEHVRTVFFEDLRKLLDKSIKRPKKFEFFYEEIDKNGTYSIDCKIELPKRPIHIFGTNTDRRCREIAITTYFLEKHGVKSFSIVIHEDQEKISPKVRTQLTDAVGKQYTSLNSAKSELKKFVEEMAITQS
jgi:hypothetical protein